MNYASTRKNLLATFQQNQTKPLTISNILTIAPLTTQPEIKPSTLTVSIPKNNTSSNMEIDIPTTLTTETKQLNISPKTLSPTHINTPPILLLLTI